MRDFEVGILAILKIFCLKYAPTISEKSSIYRMEKALLVLE